jgi:hypothetical protein
MKTSHYICHYVIEFSFVNDNTVISMVIVVRYTKLHGTQSVISIILDCCVFITDAGNRVLIFIYLFIHRHLNLVNKRGGYI